MQKTSDVVWQDTQHQMLFQLLDQLARDGDPQEVMRQLTYYAEAHFSLEETYMDQLGYPGRDDHVRAHDRFRVELNGMIENPENREPAMRSVISTFLTEWLKRHIFGIDKELEAFLLEKGVR